MNRIVLIGNGFDLAHGMKTSYNDFIEFLWEDILEEVKASDTLSVDNDLFKVAGHQGKQGELDKDFPAKRKIETLFKTRSFNNDFFKRLIECQYIEGWVDIEKEFYKRLTECYKIDQQQKTNASKKQIDQLNTDFKQIKGKLQQYLIKEQLAFNDILKKGELNFDKIARSIGSKMYKNIELRECSEDYKDDKVALKYDQLKTPYLRFKTGHETDTYYEKIFKRSHDGFSVKQLKKLMVENESLKLFINMPDEVLRLSFNYTLTEELYFDSTKFIRSDWMHPIVIKPIHIHGSIREEDKNPIIFGYGDELDDDYLEIEKLDDNRYLENIKSVKYLDRDSYKRLLEFVNSDQYQVVIMGHSCGNSDRTLLNTLFEHDNCVSIKPYYHQKEDGSDNYSDIVRNITRNFNDKQKLRDRVVNKQYCEPLL
ncbi:AbiH family protein [Nonlabens ulvanivorans]|uniref:AbiH family protein n=1 Tax=Nonlabens ulvanivorans TaxID=906888 RepID=UPI0029423A3D|nr:AbiH family protein [Nonlabens ulvanivorans]WOI21629.1 AbiH family protein [Nonlabens ulvanivorans]